MSPKKADGKTTSKNGKSSQTATTKVKAPAAKAPKLAKVPVLKLSKDQKANHARCEFLSNLAALGVVSYQTKDFSVCFSPLAFAEANKEEGETKPETQPDSIPDVSPESDASQTPGDITSDSLAESDKMLDDPAAFEQDIIDGHLNPSA